MVHFQAVFFEKLGDLGVFVGDGKLRKVAQHRGSDLILKLGGTFDLLLLSLELLLLGLDRELMGLDFILLALETPLQALVAPIGYKKPKAKQDGQGAGCC